MGALNHPSPKTDLNGRTLWFDGDSVVHPGDIDKLLLAGVPVENLFVHKVTPDISKYNSLVPPAERITAKQNLNPLSFEWNIPDKIKRLNVRKHIREQLITEAEAQGWLDRHDITTRTVPPQLQQRIERVQMEMDMYETLQLMDVLRVLIYVINTLQAHDVVWGVGRGSSVASYVLYLIGVHDIDSVLYDLDITDFLRS